MVFSRRVRGLKAPILRGECVLRVFLVAFLTASVCGCVVDDGLNIPAVVPVPIDASMQLLVQQGVRSSLKDPNSAMFRQIIAGRSATGSIVVCGYVNAKNSFGGYTGDMPFNGLLSGNRFVVTGMGGSDNDSWAAAEYCRRSGLAI